jgi:hypothetical protein
MTTERTWKILFHIIMILLFLTLGFFGGRKTLVQKEPEIITQYLPGETIIDSFYIKVPYKVIEPVDTLNLIKQCIKDGIYKELWPSRVITEYIEVTKNDSTILLKDWASKRYYSETLFDNNEYGKCIFNAEVQYNRLKLIDYSFTPIKQVITETKYDVKMFSPFIGLSYLSNPWDEIRNPMIQINGGLYIKEKYAINLIYQRGFVLKNDYVGGGLIYKF